MITAFDKSNLSTIRKDLNELMAAYGKARGIEFNLGNISFSTNGNEFTVKMGANVIGAMTRADSVFESMVLRLNLKLQGTEGRVLTGYNRKAHAYPFIYSQGGKNFKCSTESAKMYFAS